MNVVVKICAVFSIALGLATNPAIAGELADKEAVLALDKAYNTTWKDGDADAVMALFVDDAVVIPHHGDNPIEGKLALRNFWFPEGGSPTVVPIFDHVSDEVIIYGDVGVVRGRFSLVWIYEGTRTEIPSGNYVNIAVRTKDGWRIKWLTWNDDPRAWVQSPIE